MTMTMNESDSLYKDVLSYLDQYIYVINLANFKITYISPKLKELIPDFKEQAPCYKNIFKSDVKCLTCPCSFLSNDNKNLSLDLFHSLLGKNCAIKYIYSEQNDIAYLTVILSPEKSFQREEDVKRAEMYKTLTNITRILGPNENVETRLAECLEDLNNFYEADGCFFYQINRQRTYKNINEISDNSFFLDDSNIAKEWSIFFSQNGVMQLSKEPSLYFTQKMASMLGKDELIAVCVKRSGVIVGFLYVINPKKNLDMTILLLSSAPFIETEFDIDDKTSRLDYLAYTDFMTGVRNRTSYNEIIERFQKTSRPVGILFVDINGLKRENDTRGHEFGDKMIKTVATDLKDYFKKYVYRIGGDEFVVFVPDKDEKFFRKKVESYKEKMQKDVSVSLGYDWFSESTNLEKKISLVDKLMYEEKVKYHTMFDRRKKA